MLELMKLLLGITDNYKDTILNFYIEKSILAVKNYSCLDIIPEEYNNAIVDLAIYFYKNKDKIGITSMTQGSRSQSIVDGIPNSIKAILPKPKIKVVGEYVL
ncbi:MAG: DNA-packaging protein [Caloramator sp.]|jgi:hypothetical protein|uniref:phage head-tail connector protein n=1 Tax=Caloramator sp. TaxID=1871330 RepID=UPI001D5852E8|nr:phage head-tail connector protein [Caloramator sp.]MBZ4664463.1 DNA-packaging protein [Caloramator sp.]